MSRSRRIRKAAGSYELAEIIDSGHRMACRKARELFAATIEEPVSPED
jgi:hypothetical protein